MRARLPAGMAFPKPFAELFDWIEERGLLHCSQRFEGDRYGSLQPLAPPYHGAVLLFRIETSEQAVESARWLPESARHCPANSACRSDAIRSSRKPLAILKSPKQSKPWNAPGTTFSRVDTPAAMSRLA